MVSFMLYHNFLLVFPLLFDVILLGFTNSYSSKESLEGFEPGSSLHFPNFCRNDFVQRISKITIHGYL